MTDARSPPSSSGTELLPCPFCGKSPLCSSSKVDALPLSICFECPDGCSVSKPATSHRAAVAVWNTRFPSAAQGSQESIGYAYGNEVQSSGNSWFTVRREPDEYHDMPVYASPPAALPAGEKAGLEKAMEIVGNMRQSEAGLLDAKHSGQRGCDRSDALYDAYQAIELAKNGLEP